ncbi:MAG: radical SAM protein [Alphaproteobacteria bacterium]
MATLYSSLKFLRFTDRLQALKERRMAAPVHIRIKPTNRCNHNCWYCAYRMEGLKLGEDMEESDQIPEAKMMEIVDDIVAMGVKAVTFSGGGEPMLYKPLPEVIDRLAAGGVRVAALSNGSNLQGRMADAFATHGTWVRVSVDAWDDASYTASRGAPAGGFTRLIDNLRVFTARRSRCVLGISFIVTKENHEHLFDVCRLFKDVGVNHVKLSAAVVANDVQANNAYHDAIMARASEQVARARALADSGFTVLDHYHTLGERFEKDYTLCPYLMFLTVIGADLRVYTCQDKAYTEDGILGSIADRSFREFWFSEENRARIYGFDPSKLCGHHCVTHTKNLAVHDYLAVDDEHGLFV